MELSTGPRMGRARLFSHSLKHTCVWPQQMGPPGPLLVCTSPSLVRSASFVLISEQVPERSTRPTGDPCDSSTFTNLPDTPKTTAHYSGVLRASWLCTRRQICLCLCLCSRFRRPDVLKVISVLKYSAILQFFFCTSYKQH